MKNVFVIGAHGHVGQLLVPKLMAAGYHVLAGVRRRAYFDQFAKLDNVSPVIFDLTATPEEIAKVLESVNAEAIVFTAGSGGSTGDDQTLAVDLDGAIKTMIAAQKAHINRYIMVSAAGSDDREFWPESGLQGYYIAKHYADDYLRTSNLDYTILRPTALTNNDETGKINVDPSDLKNTSIPRADVANSIVTVLGDNKTIKKVYQFTSGDNLISETL